MQRLRGPPCAGKTRRDVCPAPSRARPSLHRVPLRISAIASPPKPPAEKSKPITEIVPVEPEEPRVIRPVYTADQFTSTRTFFEIAFDQVLESVTDINRHLERRTKTLPDENAPDRLMRDGDKLVFRKTRPVVLVLGTGWGSHSLVKVIDTDMYDVVVVSPRNHFLFTPMLPSTAVGTVEFRSLVEPIRVSNEFVTYFEATCDNIDTTKKIATCTAFSERQDGFKPSFEVPYDILVMAVGEQPATFGIKGVAENAFFMKEINDTIAVRNRIGKCFELAALPGATEEERYRTLSFIVVGGGPTGVEFAGTLSDFLSGDLQRKYSSLMKYVKVTLLQSMDRILPQFAEPLQAQAIANLRSTGVTVRTGVKVVEITKTQVLLADGEALDYGLCIWSCGNAARPLVQRMVESIPEQKALQRPNAPPTTHKLVVDPFLRVMGAEDIIALGDCSFIKTGPLPPTAQVAGQQGAYAAHIINQGYVFGKGGLEGVAVPRKLATLGKWRWLGDALVEGMYAVAGPQKNRQIPTRISRAEVERDNEYALKAATVTMAPLPTTSESFDEGDSAWVPPATKPAERTSDSDGALKSYDALGSFDGTPDVNSYSTMKEAVTYANCWLDYCTRPFEFLSLGIMAYIGNNKALTQIEAGMPAGGVQLYGEFAFLLWKSVYITKQVSFRNRVLILFDWLKTRFFGRDTSIF